MRKAPGACALRLAMALSAAAASIAAPPASADTTAELVEVRKIWDEAPHNAFTDLVARDGHWFCVFREGSGHVPGVNGAIRVLASDDGDKWTSAALVRQPGVDLRDPKISVTPDGRLMLLMGGSIYAGEEGPADRQFVSARSRVSFSRDGREWSGPQEVSIEGQWLWRVTWRREFGYGVGYTLSGPPEKVTIALWRTADGARYEKIADLKTPADYQPTETTVRFLADETMLALVRGDQPNRRALVGTSRPPYTEWRWTDAGHAVGGPNFLIAPDGRMFYAGRDFPAGAKTVFGSLSADGCRPLLTLPSDGDTSYPGLAWHDGLVWMSYYSSHEGKTAIYLAKIRVSAE